MKPLCIFSEFSCSAGLFWECPVRTTACAGGSGGVPFVVRTTALHVQISRNPYQTKAATPFFVGSCRFALPLGLEPRTP